MKWSAEQLNILIELYPNHSNIEIAETLGISINIVKKKSKKLRIFKTKEHKSKIIKARTRDLSYENLTEIAKKYKTKSDFQKNDSSAFSAAGLMGIKDEICKHMISQNISRPELILKYIINKLFYKYKILYNSRRIIKPYELDIYLPELRLAFEYDGLYWHKDKIDIDNIKNEMCIKNNIKLFRIIEIDYDSKHYSTSIKEKLISYLIEINNYCKTNILSEQIENISEEEILLFINNNILDYDNINIITKKYNNYKEFKTKEKSLYCKLINLGHIKEYTKHMKKDIIYWDIELCNEEINKYTTFDEFYKKSNKCYIYIQRNNLYYLLDKFKDYPRFYTRTQRLNDNYINNIIDNLKIKSLEFFKIYHADIYSYLVRHKKLYMIKNLKKKHNNHDVSEILDHNFSKYKNLSQFKNENKALFSFALRNKLTTFIKNKIENKL